MFRHGKSAELWLDAVDVSSYFNDLQFAISVDTAETTTFKATYKTNIEGLSSAKYTAKGFYDANEDAQLSGILMNAGASVLTAFPAGCVAIGDLARLVKVHTVQLTESPPVGGATLMGWDVQAEGIVGIGYGLHTLSTDTGTTTGANRDDGAASTTGWHAHLNVTAVTGAPTSWTIKLVDASASNFSDVADVTGGAFTATNNATGTAQRLSSALTTTALRRYVRYVATVVGGTAPTITFGLALSRN